MCRANMQLNPACMSSFQNLHFGEQSVDGLHLCVMTKERAADGFFRRVSSIPNRPLLSFLEGVKQVQATLASKDRSVVVMRGVPGSGKSHFVTSLTEALAIPAVVCSADNYFLRRNDDGVIVYDYNPAEVCVCVCVCACVCVCVCVCE
jgi:hypothetical protein